MSELRWLRNPWRVGSDPPPEARARLGLFGDAAVADVRAFHRTLPQYGPTPLVRLAGLASEAGVAEVLVKDESLRFGLSAFKGLGAAWAVHRLHAASGANAFVTATDGNHGRALAWAARGAGARAVIYLPGAASAGRAAAMRDLGAEVRRVNGTYDDAVAAASEAAIEEDLCLVQDMAWPGYEEIPGWIMQGYATLIDEALEQLEGSVPTHVLLPCGVGSFAASVVARLAVWCGDRLPDCVLVEPSGAPCALAALESGGDEPPLLEGDTHTFMACLSCGRLSHGAWPILRDFAHSAVAIPDEVARRGMRRLADPSGGDPAVESGESGAVGAGVLDLLAAGEAPGLAEALGLGRDSRVLVVSTEGATDPDIYRSVVGDGLR